ncbi:hypothetical protein MEI_01476 [Bartonella vinsonii subsp. arupensis Pm136co]|uniref:Phage protein n=1 Tax=Bartonella vinsonii subsp. arupensis Pm136co TaxID=1094561 RepID=A0ABP2QRI6_BARVI|nr:hypothetical protein [Bartonella vinsonii]EJF96864.1 hypothetical protein MEI_01476 [Bartonella vinsonii subsp. arupensis Pm136co]
MNKPVFIKSDEILLVMCHDERDNIAKSGPFFEEKDIIDFIDETDNAVQIFRVEPAINRCEDISEDIAEFYIKHHEQKCFDGIIHHDFVKDSDAYGFFLEEIEKQRYQDKIYGTYEEQHRLTLWDVIPNYPHYTGRF